MFRSPLRKASTITWCRDITDQAAGEDEAHRRMVDLNLESAMAKTTAVGLNRATRDRSETLSQRARRVGQGPQQAGGSSLHGGFCPSPHCKEETDTTQDTQQQISAAQHAESHRCCPVPRICCAGATRRAGRRCCAPLPTWLTAAASAQDSEHGRAPAHQGTCVADAPRIITTTTPHEHLRSADTTASDAEPAAAKLRVVARSSSKRA